MLKGLSIIAICTSLLISSSTQANPEKAPIEVICDDFKSIITTLNNFNEVPLFVGKDSMYGNDTLYTAVYHNPKTNTYTVVLVEKQSGKACVVSSGINGSLALPII